MSYSASFNGEAFEPLAREAQSAVQIIGDSTELFPEQWNRSVQVVTNFGPQAKFAQTVEKYPLTLLPTSDTTVIRAIMSGRKQGNGVMRVLDPSGNTFLYTSDTNLSGKREVLEEIGINDFAGTQIGLSSSAILRFSSHREEELTVTSIVHTRELGHLSPTEKISGDEWGLEIQTEDPTKMNRQFFRRGATKTTGTALEDITTLNSGGVLYEANFNPQDAQSRIKTNLILATLLVPSH